MAVVAAMTFSVRLNNDLRVRGVAARSPLRPRSRVRPALGLQRPVPAVRPVLIGALAARTSRIKLGIARHEPVLGARRASWQWWPPRCRRSATAGFCSGSAPAPRSSWAGPGMARPRRWRPPGLRWSPCARCSGTRDVDRTLLPAWFGLDSVLQFPHGRPVPVYVGGMGPKMLEMAGRHADGALPLLYPPEHYATARAAVLCRRGAAGATATSTCPACIWVSLSDNPAAARAALAEKLAYYGAVHPGACSRRRAAAGGLRRPRASPTAGRRRPR